MDLTTTLAALPNAHPMFVHFPIALIMALLVLDGVVILGRREALAPATGLVLLMAAAGAIAATVTGLQAEQAAEALLPNEALHETLEGHELGAFCVTGLVVGLAVWRLTLRLALPRGGLRWLYLGLLLAAVVLVALTGYLGGELVYRHGVGMPPPPVGP